MKHKSVMDAFKWELTNGLDLDEAEEHINSTTDFTTEEINACRETVEDMWARGESVR